MIDINADTTIQFARECLDTPFKHQGRKRGRGMDCAGLIIYVLKKYKLKYVDLEEYPRNPYKGMMQKIMAKQPNLKRIDRNNYKVGDVLLMKFRRDPQHLAILSYDNRIIHSYSGVGKVTEHKVDGFWVHRVVAVYRIMK